MEVQNSSPLYSKVLWNRPVAARAAGRLLIVGGHASGLANLQAVYQVATAGGIGSLNLVAPESLRSLLTSVPEVSFGPATVAGSLARSGLDLILDLADAADAVLVGPDLSNNSETAILIESVLAKCDRPLVLAADALEAVAQAPDHVRSRADTLIVLSMQQLFKLAGRLGTGLQLKPGAGLGGKVELVTTLYQTLRVDLALIGPEAIVKVGERVSVTPLPNQPPILASAASAILAVSYAQNPVGRYEGLTTGAYLIKRMLEVASEPSIAQLTQGLTKALQEHDS